MIDDGENGEMVLRHYGITA